MSTTGASPVAVVRRWEEAGGTWRVVARTPDAVTVSLCQCTGGEEVDRITSADPELHAYLGGRDRSDS